MEPGYTKGYFATYFEAQRAVRGPPKKLYRKHRATLCAILASINSVNPVELEGSMGNLEIENYANCCPTFNAIDSCFHCYPR